MWEERHTHLHRCDLGALRAERHGGVQRPGPLLEHAQGGLERMPQVREVDMEETPERLVDRSDTAGVKRALL